MHIDDLADLVSGVGEHPTGDPDTPAVELIGITKRFGDVTACDSADLRVRPGEIHGLLGQNGAGKSTLMKVLLGLMTPDAGHIRLRGEPVVIEDPLHAASLGISMVHQHFSVIEALTVWENIALGDRGRLDQGEAVRVVEEVGRRYGLVVDPDARIADLSAGQRQRVELIKCLRRSPDVLVLDEPTSVLTRAESRELFEVLQRVVREEQRAVVLISHKLDEILGATDEVTILRAGKVTARLRTADATAESLAREMVGRVIEMRADTAAALGLEKIAAEEAVDEAGPDATVRKSPPSPRAEVLRLDRVWATTPNGARLLDELDLVVHAGEIVGLAGVEGNGQSAVSALLSNALQPRSGTVAVDGRIVDTDRPGSMVEAGVGVIPEDRHASGCVLDLSVADNLAYLDLERVSGKLFVDRARLRKRAEALIEDYEVALPSIDAPMRLLSGGNQQKIVLARELSLNPRLLVAEQPTQGLDIGAIEYMNRRLREAAERGIGVLLISSELEELAALSDRIAVIHRGRIMGEMDAAEIDMERLGLMMGGVA